MRFDAINNRMRAQRARRDAEREANPRPGPPALHHGERVGIIRIEYRGQVIEAELLQAGERCRSHGLRIDGQIVGVMGLYKAAALITSRLARMPSLRSDFWV